MFTQDELEKMPEAICRRLSGANRDFLQKIGEHILKIGTISPTDMHALEQMRLFGADVAALENELAAITKKNLSEIDTIFENTARENYDFSEQFFKYKGLDFVPYDKNTALKNMVRALAKQTKDTYKNYANHTAFMVYDGANRKVMSSLSEVYSFVTDKAVLAVRTGAVDYKSAMRKTLKDLADSGIRSVYRENGRAGAVADYANGYSRRLDTAVRQNILWGVKNCNQLTADFTGEAFGADGYEIDWHGGARPSHRAMGGKQYAIGRARTVGGIYYPSFDTVAPLLEDYGCLHFKFSILLGVSAPTYSNRELKRLKAADNRKITFEGKEYTVHEATQIQRQLETKARHAKDRQIIAKAAGDETLMRAEQERINQITRKYKAFSDAAGLPVKTERMSVSKYHKVKTNAELVKNKVDNGGKSGIIKLKEPRQVTYKRFDINNQNDYDSWAEAYYTKNKPKLTKHDIAVLKEYTDGSYTAINAATRYEVGSEPYNKVCRQYAVKNLDKYKKLSDEISKAVKKFELDDDIICHRYVSNADYITGTASSVSDLEKAVGGVFTDKGFTSTCLFEHLTKKFGGKTPIHLEIRIPKGTSGAYVNDFSEKKNLEWEYLLDRGTRFKVVEGGERKTIENKWVIAERAWKDIEEIEKYMVLEVIK